MASSAEIRPVMSETCRTTLGRTMTHFNDYDLDDEEMPDEAVLELVDPDWDGPQYAFLLPGEVERV